MKKHLSLVFEKHSYPAEAAAYLLEMTDKLYENRKFSSLVENFYKEDLKNGEDIIPALKEIIAETGIHEDTVNFLYYLCVTKDLREEYKKRGIGEEIYWESVRDFRFKLDEGRAVHGVWGFFQSPWFYPFLKMTQFKLGRLEFTMNSNYWKKEYEVGGVKVGPGMPIIHVHIPASKEPFTKEACYDSYDRAYRFFKDVMKYDWKAFCCGSWLLFPEHRNILSEGSNILRFSDDFKIVDVHGYSDPREDLWRFFGADYTLPYSKLPEKTSLQRAYKKYLVSGGEPGEGIGIFLWDPDKKECITK